MLKTGIYKLSQIKNQSEFKDIFGVQKKISITLYDQILTLPNADKLAERILLYCADDRGAYKRTYAQRFKSFDKKVLSVINKEFKFNIRLLIQDAAASDARTSVDFFDKLSKTFKKLEFVASDYNPKVLIIDQGNVKICLSHNKNLLEIVWPPFVFNVKKRESYIHYPLNHLFRIIIQHFKVKPIIEAYKSGKVKARELLLFTPRAIELSKRDPRFKLTQHNLLEPFKQRSHIIRAMNVLNTSYFSDFEISKIVKNVYNGLFLNGIFIIGSNQDAGSPVTGGIYKRTDRGFKKIFQSNNFKIPKI